MQRSPLDPNAAAGAVPPPPEGTTTAAATATATAATPAVGAEAATTGGKPEEKKKDKKFHNGWTRSLEILVSEWTDIALCYRWMHDRTSNNLSSYNLYFTIPVIILTTLTGTANFGVDSLVPEGYTKTATSVIGGFSLLAGIISTIAMRLGYAQQSEAHRVAAISWGKFQRFASTELALHPNDRMDAMNFLKQGRIELDRLIEQSPNIPGNVIKAFEYEFRKKTDIRRPEIAGGIEHTRIFDDRDSRLARIASEATFLLQQKKGYMRELMNKDFDKFIKERSKEEKTQLEIELMGAAVKAAREAALQAVLETTQAESAVGKTSHIEGAQISIQEEHETALEKKRPSTPSSNSVRLEIVDVSAPA